MSYQTTMLISVTQASRRYTGTVWESTTFSLTLLRKSFKWINKSMKKMKTKINKHPSPKKPNNMNKQWFIQTICLLDIDQIDYEICISFLISNINGNQFKIVVWFSVNNPHLSVRSGYIKNLNKSISKLLLITHRIRLKRCSWSQYGVPTCCTDLFSNFHPKKWYRFWYYCNPSFRLICFNHQLFY